MKARVYGYAIGRGPEPTEIAAGRLVSRFGAEAIYHRRLSYGELNRIQFAERLVAAVLGWKRAQSQGIWAEQYPDEFKLIVEAMKFYNANHQS